MGICLIVKSGGGTDTSNANVTADKILSGYTVYSNDNKITGTMYNAGNQCKTDPNIGSTDGTSTLWPDWNFGIWGGYHDGTAVLKVGSLADATGCDIPNQWWCLTGYSYWANGSKYDGAMVNRGTKTWSIGANGSQTIEDGWHNGSGTVKQSINVDTGEWGPTPATTNQQLCWQGWYYTKNRWCWGSGNLVAGNIRSGVSIFGVWGNYVETKRWLIQNGSLTGLLSSDFIGKNTTGSAVTSNTTKSYNGATWLLLCCHQWFDGDSEVTTKVFRRFKNVNSIATFGKASWKCRLHANILTSNTGVKHFWDWSNPRASIIGMWIYNDGTWNGETRHTWSCQNDPLAQSGWLSMPNGAVGCGSVTVNTSSMTGTVIWGAAGVSPWWKWLRWTVSDGDYLIDACFNEVPNTDFWWVWAKDLWLETSETTP